MTTCLGKTCSFGLLCVFCDDVCQIMCVLLSLLVFQGGMLDWIILVPDHCLSFYFVITVYLSQN